VTGLRVSTLCLGTMTFGQEWGWGADKQTSRAIFRRFVEAGGNFIDTANNYTGGTSEKWVGEFVAGSREQFVLGTKYSLSTNPDDPNAGGNHRKNLVQALDASLRRLGTDYIDIYWLHVWDSLTPVEEVMRALDDVVRAGKVLYVGISNTPAWIISHANALADLRGWSSFAGVQAEYSLARRDAERDLLPMARALAMSFLAWSPLSNGLLTGKYNGTSASGARMATNSSSRNRPTERGLVIAKAVADAARELGCTPSQLALAWLYRKRQVIPILGCRTVDQLADNLGCVGVEIPDAVSARLEEATRIDLGFPHDFLSAGFTARMLHGNTAGLGPQDPHRTLTARSRHAQ
jgi:aryl-alcohol dehydrogenase-like predicted oxidoreductase